MEDHVQYNKYPDHQDMKMYCATNLFPELQFLGTHNKPHGVRSLDKNYHMHFDTILGHGMCDKCHISCTCTPYTYIIDQTWDPFIPEKQKPHYQTVKDCTYWPVLGYFNKWNILQLSHKVTSTEEIDKINQVVINGISENVAALVQNGIYVAIKTINTSITGYYVIKFMSESYTLQEEKMCDGQISTAGELVVKSKYMKCMQDNTKWYWENYHNKTISFLPQSQLYIPDWIL